MNEDDAKTAKELFDALDRELSRAELTVIGEWHKGGISKEEIAVHEKRLGIFLPNEYRAAFALFNGFDEIRLDLHHSGECFPGFHLSSLKEWGCSEDTQLVKEFFYDAESAQLQEEWKQLPVSVVGPAKPMVHHPKWIAITTPSAWYSWYADFAPEPGGQSGQIVFVKSDPDALHVEVVASNFFEFLNVLIDSAKAEGSCGW